MPRCARSNIGDLGWILQRHGTLYAAEFGWDATFEGFCAQIIAEYLTLRDRYPGRAAAWIAEVDGVPAGSVCCVPDTRDTPAIAARPGAEHGQAPAAARGTLGTRQPASARGWSTGAWTSPARPATPTSCC